jgi:hypothetical protein
MRWAAAAGVWLAGVVVIVLSNQAFFLAGGSDSLTDIAAPPVVGQIVAVMLVGVLLILAVWRGTPGGGPARVAAVVLSAVLLLLASHRVVIDSGQGRLRDVWVLNDLQVMQFDQRDGPKAAASLEHGTEWVRIVPRSGGVPIIIIRGVPPLAMDLGSLEVWWAQGKRRSVSSASPRLQPRRSEG